MESAYHVQLTDEEFSDIVTATGWSYDAWIQNAYNGFIATGRSRHVHLALIANYALPSLRHTS
jgi:hypothetical protein